MSNNRTKTDGNQICNQTLKIRIIKYPYHQLTQTNKNTKKTQKNKKQSKTKQKQKYQRGNQSP